MTACMTACMTAVTAYLRVLARLPVVQRGAELEVVEPDLKVISN